METGASVPGYSGGLAACVVSGSGCRFFIVAGGADPGRGAERLAERLVGGEPAANQSVRIGDLRDVARGPSVETGADVPSYSGGLAAW